MCQLAEILHLEFFFKHETAVVCNEQNTWNTDSNFKILYHTFLNCLLWSCVVSSSKCKITDQMILILLIVCVFFDASFLLCFFISGKAVGSCVAFLTGRTESDVFEHISSRALNIISKTCGNFAVLIIFSSSIFASIQLETYCLWKEWNKGACQVAIYLLVKIFWNCVFWEKWCCAKYLVLIKNSFYDESLLVFLDCWNKKKLRKTKMSVFTSIN